MRTYIFGAGASKHAGYPLAKDLWRDMEGWTLSTFVEGHPFRQAVETMNAEFDLTKSFELVLTDLDDRVNSILGKPRRTWEECEEHAKFVNVLRPTVGAMIPVYFDSLRSKPAEQYRRFANDVVMPGDCVITFNYDLALDRELSRAGNWDVGNGYGFCIDDVISKDSACKLFKLHGSTNWLGELFQGRGGFGYVDPTELSLGQRPIIDQSSFEYLGYTNASDPKDHNARVSIPSLILPTAKKKFYMETTFGREWENFWNSLWSQAGKALRASDEVYLIGYSLPEYDVRARELLAMGVDRKAAIRVCCLNETARVVDAIRQLVNADVRPACATDFDGWLSCMKGI